MHELNASGRLGRFRSIKTMSIFNGTDQVRVGRAAFGKVALDD